MRLIRAIVAAMAATAVMMPAAPASAQSGDAIFLKLAGIEGESQDVRHNGEIEVLSWSWGVSMTPPSGGGGAGKPTVQDLSFTKYSDKATPKILEAAIKGKALHSAVLSVDTGGENPQTYLKVTMTDVLVTSIQTSQSSGDRPMENVTLNFSRIKWEHRPQNADGSLGEPVSTCWDVRANRAC